MGSRRALICGVSGQDGAYLSKLLLEKGYEVVGTSRDAEMSRFENLNRLSIKDAVDVRSMTLNDFRSVLQVISDVEPTEIYNLAGQTSVGLSFQQPVEALESIALGTLNLLEAVRFFRKPIAIYNAASSECFGYTDATTPSSENSPFRPKSPYGVAKSAAYWEVVNYREAYGLFACSGILFNHESPLRPLRFVTRKIVAAVCAIAAGSSEKLSVGDLNIVRDWGYAPEYVEAMWLMLQQRTPRDFVIATGESHSLRYFISLCFEAVNLDWQDHTLTNHRFLRKTDIKSSYADPSFARDQLGWSARTKIQDLVRCLIDAERYRIEGGV